MTSRTRFVISHVERAISPEVHDTSDSQAVAEMIQRALSDSNGFKFIQLQRPEPLYYKKLLRATREQRADLLAKKGKDGRMFAIALEDLQEVLGDFEGPGIQPGDFSAPGKKSRQVARREVLKLCLDVVPFASRDTVNLLLTKHLGAAPLHMRNPMDAVYAFALISRDAGAKNFATLEQQRSFIDEQLLFISTYRHTQNYAVNMCASFDEAAALSPDAFGEWYLAALSDRKLLRLSMTDPKKDDADAADDAQAETDLHRAASELILCAPDQRASLIARKRKHRQKYENVDRQLKEIIGGEYSGSAERTALRFRPKQSMEGSKSDRQTALRQRRDDLDLILGMEPALDVQRANRLLTEVMGVPALDAQRAVDAVYAYLLQAQEDRLPGLEQKRDFARRLFARAESEYNWGVPLLPSTRVISSSLSEVDPGDIAGFGKWLLANIDNMDRLDHHYWARVHFGDSLRMVARGNDAARLTAVTSTVLSDLNLLAGEDGDDEDDDQESPITKIRWFLNDHQSMCVRTLRDLIYRRIENSSTAKSDDQFACLMLSKAVGIPAASNEAPISQGESYLSAMEIMTDGLGLDFYNIWHTIGVQYLMEIEGDLPKGFPEASRWREYYQRMMDEASRVKPEIFKNSVEGTMFEKVLSIRMVDEPDFLAALRSYAKVGVVPEICASQIRAVMNAMELFEELIGQSSLLYLTSDWHYACICGEYAPGVSARGESDSESYRIKRVTSRTNRVYDEDRTDVPDVPRGLLILSELARINVVPDGRYNAEQLTDHINRMLSECGYAMLDVRRRLDFMFYCAIRTAEVHSRREEFSFEHILDGLHEYIRSHIFSGLVGELLTLYDFILPPSDDETDA